MSQLRSLKQTVRSAFMDRQVRKPDQEKYVRKNGWPASQRASQSVPPEGRGKNADSTSIAIQKMQVPRGIAKKSVRGHPTDDRKSERIQKRSLQEECDSSREVSEQLQYEERNMCIATSKLGSFVIHTVHGAGQ